MFFFGENQPPAGDDYRPEVHDSDGLSIQSGDRRMDLAAAGQPEAPARHVVRADQSARLRPDAARPLVRRATRTSRRATTLRPSAWVEPIGEWGPGRVELVQIPTPDETNDNIVAYWVPDALPRAGQAARRRLPRCCGRRTTETRPPHALGRRRRGAGAATCARPTASIELHRRLRGSGAAQAAPDAPVEAVFTVDANAEIVEATASQRDRRRARDGALQRNDEPSRSSCARTCATERRCPRHGATSSRRLNRDAAHRGGLRRLPRRARARADDERARSCARARAQARRASRDARVHRRSPAAGRARIPRTLSRARGSATAASHARAPVDARRQGRERADTAPPLARGSMAPRAWLGAAAARFRCCAAETRNGRRRAPSRRTTRPRGAGATPRRAGASCCSCWSSARRGSRPTA